MLHFRSPPNFGFGGSKEPPPAGTKRFSLTANVKVFRSRLSPLDAGGRIIGQPGESQHLTVLKVTWVSSPYPSDSAASSARWLVTSAQKLWQRDEGKGDMGDPGNTDLRDRFIQTLASALFKEKSRGVPGFSNDVFDPSTLTFYDYKSFKSYNPRNEVTHLLAPEYFARAVRDFVEGILQMTLAGESIPDISRDPVFRWIDATMKGRAFFTADHNFGWNGLSSMPVDIIAIGPSDVTLGDGVLAFSRYFYGIPAPSPDFGELYELEDMLDNLDVMEGLDGYDDAVRDPTQLSPARQNVPTSPPMMSSLEWPRKGWRMMEAWKSIFDMTYLVRVVNRHGSHQDLQEGLCWDSGVENEKASRSQDVGYELIGECQCAGSIFDSGEQEWTRWGESTCEARDDQGKRYLTTWRLEDKHVTMYFV